MEFTSNTPSRRQFIQSGVAAFTLLSGCSFFDPEDELADLSVLNRTDREVTAKVVVTHSESGNVVFDQQIKLGASSREMYQDPFNRTGEHHVKVTTSNELKNEDQWLVRPESDGRNSEMLIITIEDTKIRFTPIE